jgi:hypothetical protein
MLKGAAGAEMAVTFCSYSKVTAMPRFANAFIAAEIATAARENKAIDVYGLARKIHADNPDHSFEEVAAFVTQSVVQAHAAAVWDRRPADKATPAPQDNAKTDR